MAGLTEASCSGATTSTSAGDRYPGLVGGVVTSEVPGNGRRRRPCLRRSPNWSAATGPFPVLRREGREPPPGRQCDPSGAVGPDCWRPGRRAGSPAGAGRERGSQRRVARRTAPAAGLAPLHSPSGALVCRRTAWPCRAASRGTPRRACAQASSCRPAAWSAALRIRHRRAATRTGAAEGPARRGPRHTDRGRTPRRCSLSHPCAGMLPQATDRGRRTTNSPRREGNRPRPTDI